MNGLHELINAAVVAMFVLTLSLVAFELALAIFG